MRRLRIIERKLGRERALGQSMGDGTIEVDPRQRSQDYLDTLIHEALHELFRDMTEAEVKHAAETIASVIWRRGYRRIAP